MVKGKEYMAYLCRHSKQSYKNRANFLLLCPIFAQSKKHLMQATDAVIYTFFIFAYFALLALIAQRTGKRNDAKNFFLGGRNSPWFLVAFGMVGASLSGVTFVSIPGTVGAQGPNAQFAYMQMVLGYIAGYICIGAVLLPIYYRMQLTSIYGYLRERYGQQSQRTGAGFFILSRSIGSALRLYLTVNILHNYLVAPFLPIPFAASAALSLSLIWFYTRKGGLRTVVYTDVLQTSFMLIAALGTVAYIGYQLGPGRLLELWQEGPSQVFFFEEGWSNPDFFFKQFLAGFFICLAMTGLDQDMMQKNLSCRSLQEAQKNVYVFSFMQALVNGLFLLLGLLLWAYAQSLGLDSQLDKLYPDLAFEHLPLALGLLFVLGLVAAAYSSADSSVTALTTSFCMDFLGFRSLAQDTGVSPIEERPVLRRRIHFAFSLWMCILLLLFHALGNASVINLLFRIASYTYGPLLALFLFGIFSRRQIHDALVPYLAFASIALSYLLNSYSEYLFWGYRFGFELLLLNAGLMAGGLWLISGKAKKKKGMALDDL